MTEEDDIDTVERPLTLLAGANFTESDIRVAAELQLDPKNVDNRKSTLAIEKKIDDNTLLKARLIDFREFDLALKMRLSDKLDLTICCGLAGDEQTESGRQIILKELEETNEIWV